jgi:nitrite reductase (NO-forming)
MTNVFYYKNLNIKEMNQEYKLQKIDLTNISKSLLLLTFLLFAFSCRNKSLSESEVNHLKHVTQQMVPPPGMPQFEEVDNEGPKIVDVTFEVQEKKIEVAPGDSVWAFTYNGTVPGPMIVVHQDDYIELTLKNPVTNPQMHNIDFHAATGAMGGGDISLVNPGQQVKFRFKCTRPGVFVYHCAPGGAMVPIHVASGMNGAIMVLPRDGLKDENGRLVKFDKAFYIVEQAFYLPKGKDSNIENISTVRESIQKTASSIRTLMPTNIVFNGREGSLTGKNALKAKVGDNVLIITAEANRDTRIHLIGGHADLYWPGGKFDNKPLVDNETWAIPGGSAAAVMYKFKEPGTYLLLNHNLIEAFDFGAIAQIKVDGDWDSTLMKQIQSPMPIR